MESIQVLKIIAQLQGVKEPKQPTHNVLAYAYTFIFKIKLKRKNVATSV